jgi:hypothetical protein
MNLHRAWRGSTIVLVGAVAVYSWIAAGLRPFTLGEEVLVAVPGLVCLAAAIWTSGTTRTDSADASRRGSAAIWLVLVVAVVGWELAAYFSSPRSAHPTLSVIADNVMSIQPGRALVFALWLALGWMLVRGSRATQS